MSSDGLLNTQETLSLKLLNGDLWVEVDNPAPLSRDKIRKWVVFTEQLKTELRSLGYTRVLAGCSNLQRVKWASKLFGFEPVKEITVDGHSWHIVQLCF